MKSNKKLKIVLLIAILAIVAAGFSSWYFLIKKPYDNAVSAFNDAAAKVNEKNREIDEAINSAKEVLNTGSPVYDETTINDLTVAISEANLAKREIPKLPDETENIVKATKELSDPLDYSDVISNIDIKKKALENSVKQMMQITNPSGDFIIQRLQGIEGISSCQAVTEDHDPNGMLNKQGGYTSATYFSSPWINQDEVYGNDVVDKGTECGGGIEVYPTVEDAEKRNLYLSSFDGSGFLNPGSHVVLGTIVIRTSSKLTATQQNDLTQKIVCRLLSL